MWLYNWTSFYVNKSSHIMFYCVTTQGQPNKIFHNLTKYALTLKLQSTSCDIEDEF